MALRAEPYVPGLQANEANIIKLNTNENAYGPSKKVIEAIKNELDGATLQLYPSPTADDLRQTIGDYYNISKDHVFVGNGSDEVLAFAFMAFFEPEKTILFPNITYSFYPVYAKVFNIPFEQIKLNEDFTLSIEEFYHSEGGVILPNPNAPTSIYAPLDQIENIVKNNPDHVVIIDEAYIDYAGESAVSLIEKYENLLVVQTTSKSRALAGLRVGLAMGHPTLIDGLIRIKDSFNSYPIDRLALVGAKAAFEDVDYFKEMRDKVIATRDRVISKMNALGFDVLPSQANFIFATHYDYDASKLYGKLKEEGILVRYFSQKPIDNFLRITIGTDEQMNQFFNKLEKIIESY